MQELQEAAVEKPVPVATLFIHGAKGTRVVFAYGRSGTKYKFHHDPSTRMTIRTYQSVEVFRREELDLRRNATQPHPICTMMGAINPAQLAVESVRALLADHLRVSVLTKREALIVIGNEIEKWLIESQPATSDKTPFQRGDDPIRSSTTFPERASVESDPGSQSSTAPSPNSPVSSSETSSGPIGEVQKSGEASPNLTEPIPKYKNRDLQRMLIDELRALGARHGSTATDRKTLIPFILEAQGPIE